MTFSLVSLLAACRDGASGRAPAGAHLQSHGASLEGAPTFSSSATSSPPRVAPGATAVISARVTNTSTTSLQNGVVYLELFDPSGARVMQTYCSGVNVTGGASTNCAYTWTAQSALGTYAVQVGVFDASWGAQYHWNNNAGTVNVGNPTFASSAAASPASLAPGQSSAIVVSVTNTSAYNLANGIVYAHVYNGSGTLVAQWNCPGTYVAAGASASCQYGWVAPSTVDTYLIAVAVFGANWPPQYHWQSNAGTVTVQAPGNLTFTTSASANPTGVAPGASSVITTTVTNTSATNLVNGIVYTEVYDPGGARVAQGSCTGVNLAAGASTSCPYTWTAPSALGTYSIEVGVFGANWTPRYDWNNVAGQVGVVTTGPPTFSSVASANPTTVAGGATAAITATVTNPSASALVNGIIYTQISNSSGTLVWQSFCSGVNVNAGARTSCPRSWTAPSTPGTYSFQVGVYGASWSPQYHWNDSAGTVSVGGGTGSSATAALVAKLGKPARLLIGLGGANANQSDIQTQEIKIDIFEHYLAYLPDRGGWPTWNVDANGSGAYVTQFATEADSLGAVPMFTLYQMANWGDDRQTEMNALGDASFMQMYWAAAKLMYTRLGAYNKPALVNLEPDFWGYCQQTASQPSAIYANVQSAGSDCSGLPNTVPGMAQCLIRLARTHAPKALVGFRPSLWGHTAQSAAEYMLAVGAGQGDFVVTIAMDHDAGCFEVQGTNCVRAGSGWYWGTADFEANISDSRTFGQVIGKPLLWWQVPLGVARSTPGGTTNHYRDNRVQYFFANPSQLVTAGAFGIVYGAGADTDTLITTDGGQFQRATQGYFAAPAPLP